MANVEIQLCDLCETPLEGYHPRGSRIVKAKQGLLVQVGYSNGGWGFRQNHINFSGEVCTDCYDAILVKVHELDGIIQSLKPKKQRNGILGLLK